MNKVYRHKPLASDEYLGWVAADGKVYESRFGPDKYVGHVDLRDGRVYESRFGPDDYIGRVDIESGKIYFHKFGPDDYLGRVEKDGDLRYHKAAAPDEYLGKVTEMVSWVHAGGAFLLLMLPAIQEGAQKTAPKPEPSPPKTGGETKEKK